MTIQENKTDKLTLRSLIGSTLAAAFGVQSNRNRERDFGHGSGTPFIYMGIGFTVFFVIFILGLVNFLVAINT